MLLSISSISTIDNEWVIYFMDINEMRSNISKKYRLSELYHFLDECEDAMVDTCSRLKVQEKSKEYFLITTLGKSVVSMKEVMTLCINGFPEGAYSIARNLYEQFIIVSYIEDELSKTDNNGLLDRYFDDFDVQSAKNLKQGAEYWKIDADKARYEQTLNLIKEKYGIKRLRGYWWAGNDINTFSDMVDHVLKNCKDCHGLERFLHTMHMLYKRSSISLHASIIGNTLRMGSDSSAIETGPWLEGHESALHLATASLSYVMYVVFNVLNVQKAELISRLVELSNYYVVLLNEGDDSQQIYKL